MSSSDVKPDKNPEDKKLSGEAVPRPPIVVVMGHVDHGKTSLLDYIRKTKVAEKEAGGITQSIGAYEIEWRLKDDTKSRASENDRGITNDLAVQYCKITFIDTPGHAAFTKMRERGAKAADIAILVVAADDGVQPQTEEAIAILQKSKTPFVVAINKTDRSNADPERVKQDLLAHGVKLESFGGHVSWHLISAKTGEGVDELLELIVLMWQMETPTYNPSGLVKGFILESEMDSRRGVVASVIVTDGILKNGQNIVTPSACGKIKMLENFLGEKTESFSPSSPALVVGFERLPAIGEEFKAGHLEIEERPEMGIEERRKSEILMMEKEENVLPLVLKADVAGSLEALSQMIASMSFEGLRPKIVSQEVGDVTDGDVKSAQMLGALVVGFNCRLTKPAESLARSQNVEVITSDVIYRLVEQLEEKIKNLYVKKETDILEILAVFGKKGRKQIVGGRVVEGFFTLNQKVKIERQNEVLGWGRISNLQKEKKDCRKVDEGNECGLMIDSDIEIQVGDRLVIEK